MRTEGVRLTRREEEVLELVFLGLADKEIPEHLPTRSGAPVSVSTVRNIITGIKAKLHVQHRTEMSLWWAIKRYNISVDWTPLRRRICAMMMLVLLVTQIVSLHGDMIRTRRSGAAGRTMSSRVRRGRRDDSILEDDTLWNII